MGRGALRLLRSAGILAVEVALVLAVPLLLLAPVHAATPPTPPPFTATVSAAPAAGSAPLVVTLTAAVSSGTPSTVAWTFGDGGSWTGTGTAGLSVVHRYVNVGSYSAAARVTEATGSVTATTLVTVENGPLVAVIAVTPSAPSTGTVLTFRAVVSGGTGTYTAFDWTFGDGGSGAGPAVQYAYTTAGTYSAQLTVVDSDNDTATAQFVIVVAAVPTVAGSGSTALSAIGPTTIATAGMVSAGLTWGVLFVGRRRRHPSSVTDESGEPYGALPPGVFGPTFGSMPALAAASVPAEEAAASSAELAEPAAASTASLNSLARVAPSLPTVEPAAETRPTRAPGEEPRRWSREIVAYLGGLPTLGPDDIASLDWTQKGMSDRLGTGQNQVSNVLRRLVAAGLVVEELQHVQGQPRRLKVYRLSLRGEALAREMRRHRPGATPTYMRAEW
jgi:PKD repeat protein